MHKEFTLTDKDAAIDSDSINSPTALPRPSARVRLSVCIVVLANELPTKSESTDCRCLFVVFNVFSSFSDTMRLEELPDTPDNFVDALCKSSILAIDCAILGTMSQPAEISAF
jgi:hypothetical protein